MAPEVINEIGEIINKSLNTNMSSFRLGVWIFIAIGGINCILNIIAIFITKQQEVKTNTTILKKKNEMRILKNIYNSLTNIRYVLIDQNNDQSVLEQKIREVRKILRKNELVLSKSLIKNVNDYLDYFSIIVIDRSNRDLRLEEEYCQKIKKNYQEI